MGPAGATGAAEQQPPGPGGMTGPWDIPWSPRVPGLCGASPGGFHPAHTPAAGVELPACTLCCAELGTLGNLRPSLKEETKALCPCWGDGASTTHPVSSDCSRPTGHRHWLASQELCRW